MDTTHARQAILAAAVTLLAAGPLVAKDQQSPPSTRDRLPSRVRKTLDTLPPDTETLIVARDFTLPKAGRQPLESGRPLHAMARFLCVAPQPDVLQQALAGRRVEAAVHGARNTDVVSAFGSIRQEGAAVVHLAKALHAAESEPLRRRLRKQADDVRTLAGHDVFVFPSTLEMEPAFEPKPWQGTYVVLLDRDTVVTATSDRYLDQFLQRTRHDSHRDHALPAELDEWPHVDLDSDVWLLRRLPDENAQWQRLHGDQQRNLQGLVWMVGTSDRALFRAVYLPREGRKVLDLARRPWLQPGEDELPPARAALLEFQTADDGTVTVTFARRKDDSQQPDPRLQNADARQAMTFVALFYLAHTQGLYR